MTDTGFAAVNPTVLPHDHLEYRLPGQYGFSQTVPTWLINSEITTPPGDTPLSYAMPLHIPAGQKCTAVAVALRGTSSTIGSLRAAVYEKTPSGRFPIAVTDNREVNSYSGWYPTSFIQPIPAADHGRSVYVMVSVAQVVSAYVKTHVPTSEVQPYFTGTASYVSVKVDEPPAVLEVTSFSPNTQGWQASNHIPLIALG